MLKEYQIRCIGFLQQLKTLSRMDCMIYTGDYLGIDNLYSRVKNITCG